MNPLQPHLSPVRPMKIIPRGRWQSQSKFGLPPSPIDDILPPLRPLTTEEHSELTDILRSTLNLSNTSCAIQAEEDACDLINYAFELIDDKMTVCDVIEELEFMDLEICRELYLLYSSVICKMMFVTIPGRRGSRCKIFVHGGCDDDG